MFYEEILTQFETTKDPKKVDWASLVKQRFLSETDSITGRIGSSHSIPRTKAVIHWDVLYRNELNRALLNFYTQLKKNILQDINNITSESLYEKQDRRKIYELLIDGCNEGVEDIMTNFSGNRGAYYADKEEINLSEMPTKFEYYPEIATGDEFITNLLSKKEFYENQNDVPSKNNGINAKGFRKSSVQKFAKNYISNRTPYNGLLLWHEVGVGKTCAAIGIAENFKTKLNVKNKKIIILTPGNTLRESWYDEIYNIKKELKNLKSSFNKQCTGETYNKFKLIKHGSKNYTKIKRRRDKLINKYYAITGYQTFVNEFDRAFDAYYSNMDYLLEFHNRHLIKFIQEKFSDSVIILDEIHETREGTVKNSSTLEGKKIRRCLELIVRYGNNIRLVLLSATPMYDKADEIIWLINLLRLNDGKSPLVSSDYFNKNGSLKSDPDVQNLLVDRIRGYVSYQRGEDPFVFPTKLYPYVGNEDYKNLYIPNTPECLKLTGIKDVGELRTTFPEKYAKIIGGVHNPISFSYAEENKNLVIYRSFMGDWQYKHYNSLLLKNKSGGYNIHPRQYANFIFPALTGTGKLSTNAATNDNFKKLFIKDSGKYTINKALIRKKGSILNSNYIGKYSKKFENILNIIKKSDGIIFIYSQFINYGAKLLAFCLEENGFNRFYCNSNGEIQPNKNFITNPTCDKTPNLNYILLTGSTPKNILNKLKDYSNAKENKFGNNIKVIIGTSVVEQGISFFNIRQVHIMDPWYNINSLWQVIGRAVRRYSHHMLEEAKRNVTIFLHASVAPTGTPEILDSVGVDTSLELVHRKDMDKKVLLIDENLYSQSIEKYTHILTVQRLLKRGAVDCNLNKKGNIFLGDSINLNIPIVDSRMNIRGTVSMNDEEGSIKCDLQECNYTCSPDIDMHALVVNEDTYDNTVLSEEILNYKEEIKNIFTNILAIDFIELKKLLGTVIKSQKSSHDVDEIIMKSLESLILNEEQVHNRITRVHGKIIKTGKKEIYYVFQPIEINKNQLIRNKYLPRVNNNYGFNISNIKTSHAPKITKRHNTIDNLIDLLVLSIFNSIITYWEDAVPMIESQGVSLESIYSQFSTIKSFIDTVEEKQVPIENIRQVPGEVLKKYDNIKGKFKGEWVNAQITKVNGDGTYNLIYYLNKKTKVHINYYDSGDFTKFGYDKTGILKFGDIQHSKTYFEEHILTKRREKQFAEKYAFNNFRLSVFDKEAYDTDTHTLSSGADALNVQDYVKMGTIQKPKKKGNFDLKYDQSKLTINIQESDVISGGKILNRFYDGDKNNNLPNICDIIYNHFLTYIEDKPMEMLNEDLKNMFSEIYDEPSTEYLPGLFNYGSEITDNGKYRIDFGNIADKTILRKQVIKIFFYSYFSIYNDTPSDLDQTHNFKKFSYFLTQDMYNISVGKPATGDNKIKYLIIPTSSRMRKKIKGKVQFGRLGLDFYDIYTKSDDKIVKADVEISKTFFNNFFTKDLLNPFKAKIFGFTAFSKQYSFQIVNKDIELDKTYMVKHVKGGRKSKKTERTGALCGTARGGKTKQDIGKLINSAIIKITGDNAKEKYNEGGSKYWKQFPNSIDLCMELKFLLRHLDHLPYYYIKGVKIIKSGTDSARFFYHEHIKKKLDRNLED